MAASAEERQISEAVRGQSERVTPRHGPDAARTTGVAEESVLHLDLISLAANEARTSWKCPLPGMRNSTVTKPAGPSLPLPFTSLLHIEKLLEIQNRVKQIFPHLQARRQFLQWNLMQAANLAASPRKRSSS